LNLLYIGILQGKYPIPDSSTAVRRTLFTPLDLNYPRNSISMTNQYSLIFFKDNASMIYSIIETYDEKLKPFLSMEETNKFVQDWIIYPIKYTHINNIEELNKHIKKLNNLVGYIRIKRRLGDKTKPIFPDIKSERKKL